MSCCFFCKSCSLPPSLPPASSSSSPFYPTTVSPHMRRFFPSLPPTPLLSFLHMSASMMQGAIAAAAAAVAAAKR